MPIEVVSVRVRAPALGENPFWSCVLDSSRYSEAKWENEETSQWGRSGTGEERQRCRWIDERSKSLSKWSPRKGKSCHLAREEWFFYSTRQFFKEIAILWRNSSISNNELRKTNVNCHTEKQTDFKGCRRQIKEIRREQNNCTTSDQYFVAPCPFKHQDLFFCGRTSYLTVISERLSYHPGTK